MIPQEMKIEQKNKLAGVKQSGCTGKFCCTTEEAACCAALQTQRYYQ